MAKYVGLQEGLSMLKEKGIAESDLGIEEREAPRIVSTGFLGISSDFDHISEYVNTRIFVSEFTESDIDYFLTCLDKVPSDAPGNSVRDNLISCISRWIMDNPQGSCYEVFLWALKIHDNYVGTIKGGAVPDSRKMSQVVDALSTVWDSNNTLLLQTIKNVLSKWTWFQPIHVCLALYGKLSKEQEVKDEEIDELIRTNWLKRALYTRTAFFCLCDLIPSQENIKAIMEYIKVDRFLDDTETPIEITKPIRKAAKYYLVGLDKELMSWAKSYYRDAMKNCSRASREVFSDIFEEGPGSETPELELIVSKWAKSSSSEKQVLLSKFKVLFTAERSQVSVLERLPSGQLVDAALSIIDTQGDLFQQQFTYMALISANRQEYRQYIFTKAEQLSSSGVKNDEWFVACCAASILGKTEYISDLCKEIFTNGTGATKGQFIFNQIRTRYINQFNDALTEIIRASENSLEMANSVILNCVKIYKRSITYYPIVFDRLAMFVLNNSVMNPAANVRYIKNVLDLIDGIANPQNRTRYYDMLMIISSCTSIPADIKKRAESKIATLYPPQ